MGADALVMIDLIVDIMFIFDILINFRTTYVSKQVLGTAEKKTKKRK